MLNSKQGDRQKRQRRRQRIPPFHRRTKLNIGENQTENKIKTAEELFNQCERTKEKLVSSTVDQSRIWIHRQEFLDQYEELLLFDLDFAVEKKLEHDVWTIVFKNDMTQKQEQLKIYQDNPSKRNEIQTSLQILYEFGRGFYLKLLQDVVLRYKSDINVCRSNLIYSLKSKFENNCKEASIVYLIQHILIHVGDLNRYSNKLDLSKIFYENAIETIPCSGQPFNQIAILHEMKNSPSNFSLGENQLTAGFFYVRSIAIKVAFPLAISNLEKFFQRFEQKKFNEKDFLENFLKIIAMINLDREEKQIEENFSILRSTFNRNFSTMILTKIIGILIFSFQRSITNSTRNSTIKKISEKKFDFILKIFLLVIEQLVELSQMPIGTIIVDEQQILPALYLCFSYLSNLQKTKIEIFKNFLFQQANFWNSLGKLLRSFAVSARTFETNKNENSSLFLRFSDYPLPEERFFEAFTPFNDIFKSYNFRKYRSINAQLIEKDERQLRKLRLVFIVRQLCQKFDFLLTYVKDDLIYFESTSPAVQQISSSNFGVPGDRRATQKINNEDKSNSITTKNTRGARNVALRQFLEPNINISGSSPNTPTRSEPWPTLTQSKDLFQNPSIDDESHVNSVWSNGEETSTGFNSSILPSNFGFPSRPNQTEFN